MLKRFWIWRKFDDSVDNVRLILQVSRLRWNPVVLYMSLLVHLTQERHSRFPVQIGQQVDDFDHHRHAWLLLQALHKSVEATCMSSNGLSDPDTFAKQNGGCGFTFVSRTEKICENPRQERSEMSKEKRAPQSDPERVSKEARDQASVQDWDFAYSDQWSRWNGSLPEFVDPQQGVGCRIMRQLDHDCVHHVHPALPPRRDGGPCHCVC